MNAKFRFPSIFFMFSLFLVVAGVLFKTMHWDFGADILALGLAIMIIAIITIIVALFKVKST